MIATPLHKTFAALLLLLSAMLTACSEMAPTHEVQAVDSLNTLAHSMWYRDIDTACSHARKAFDRASIYGQGKAEACNNIAYCHFMKMDFEQAEMLYNSTRRYTQNEPELLIADIGLMQICQRTAMNKEFYDHRNSAAKRMKRIDEEKSLFYDHREKSRISYAYTEFHLTSALYYYSLRQRQEAQAELNCIDASELASYDAGQYMRYLHLRGLTGMSSHDGTDGERLLSEFDDQCNLFRMATDSCYTYLIGEGLLGMAEAMATRSNYELISSQRTPQLEQLGLQPDSLLPLHIAEMARQAFATYRYTYGVSAAYVAIASYLNETERYSEAFDTLRLALDCVNSHHASRYHGKEEAPDHLLPYGGDSSDEQSPEMKWIRNERTKTIPEWISAIREQLSVAYAGMGMKRESDYNRNIYLDILNNTRQDCELESRYAALEEESDKLTIVLVATIVAFIIMMSMLTYLSRRTRQRGEEYTARLRSALALCSDITSHKAVAECTDPYIRRLIAPFTEWAERNEQNSEQLTEEREELEAQRYIHERHIDEDKRRNIVRRACLSLVYGITPYIDRMINEVDKLIGKGYIDNEEMKSSKLQYIGELADIINEQNEILALWIKMRRGAIQLNVENFQLQELFALLQKGRRSFEMKRQTLTITDTPYIVKADKGLTLFMLNTLMENARKYTPEGGSINIYADASADYVEISVKDTGIGLSDKDIDTIINSKVYDSKAIGINNSATRSYLMDNKGGGFGLMNCKGIIEKYRKTNRLFSVCTFGIDSHPGHGSRFFFRLPMGVLKGIALLLIFLTSLTSCEGRESAGSEQCNYASTTDSTYTVLLDSASLYADSVYYSNVEHRYEEALVYASKALAMLNRHYATYSGNAPLLHLSGNDTPAEFTWWSNDFDTDYHVILDIRNEAAVAFLALKQLDGYRYNNEAYAGMYKLQGKDTTLESYCHRLERSAVSKTIGVVLCIALLILSAIAYYILFIRKRIVEVINLRQVIEINHRASVASQPCSSGNAEALQMEEDTLHDIPQRIVDETFESINDLLDIDHLGLAVCTDTSSAHCLYVSVPSASSSTPPAIVERCRQSRTLITEGGSLAIPLMAEADDGRCIGVLHLELTDNAINETRLLFAELVAKYFAIVIYNSVICPAVQYRDIEAAHEEVHRASWESSMLHVQNLVLDNCLSTIKHETIYYPSRIRNILATMAATPLTADEERRQVEDISELVRYYRGVFAILYSCAARQLDEVTFRRATIAASELTTYCSRYFARRKKALKSNLQLTVAPIDASVIGDRISLQYLIENLIDEALAHDEDGELELSAATDGDYIRFCFTDMRRSYSDDELNRLFTPDLRRMTTGDELCGTEYLICKQIIREHDEYAGRRGCRINAEQHAGGGFTVYFTIPKR